jgi:hypothetical protein
MTTQEPEISATGVFWDSQAQQVVESQPTEGIQLCAPGSELTKTVKDDIDRWREVESAKPVPADEPKPEPKSKAKAEPEGK